ncbi:MAG TPA: bifunctional hydroxymethylpyrimidine kinase/phosphomethylpyrimidine kinase [Bacillota bacterium]
MTGSRAGISRIPRALTIAGSDSGGGAGIQADLKAFLAAGVYGMSAITGLTAQNTVGVRGVHLVPEDFIVQQFDAVVEDIGVDAVKTGMLATAGIVEAVAASIRRHGIENLVVDPVMIAKSGDALLDADAAQAVRRRLLPLALIATPNLHEAGAILGRPVETLAQMEQAACDLHALGVRYPVVKGGHLPAERALADRAVDVVFDGRDLVHLEAPRIATRNTHGTGCTFSAAICAALARGLEPLEAIRYGKRVITEAVAHALDLGAGHGPTNPGQMVRDPGGLGDPGEIREPGDLRERAGGHEPETRWMR